MWTDTERERASLGEVEQTREGAGQRLLLGEMEGKEAGEGGEKRRVMLAIDESECSHHALEWAVEFLRDGAPPLVIFTAQPVANLSYIPAAIYGSARRFTAMTATPELIHSLQEHQRNVALALLEHARELCAKHGVNAEAITEVGDPKEAICEAVEKYKISLLILGSHGRGMFQRAFLGSVSNYCAHHAKCAVLIVKK